MDKPLLKMRNLAVGYKQRHTAPKVVLPEVSLELNSGEMVCLIGPNGAGKSTLLRTASGLQEAISGSVELDGRPVSQIHENERARLLSIVLTEKIDAGMITVFSLVSLGRYPYTSFSGKLDKEDLEIVKKALKDAGADELADRAVSTLSDGERQKVMIARALAQDTDVIILDEPTAFLDLPRRTEVTGLLKRLTRETGKAIVLSTHDLHLALRNADKLWLISEDGRVHSGAPEDLILDRRLENAFTGERIHFDRYHGLFSNTIEGTGTAGISGTGLHTVWVKRALERAGYNVKHLKHKPAADLLFNVEVLSSDEEVFSCRLNIDEQNISFNFIGELIDFIRKKG